MNSFCIITGDSRFKGEPLIMECAREASLDSYSVILSTSSPKQRLGSDSPRDGNRAKKCREIIALKYCDTAYNG